MTDRPTEEKDGMTRTRIAPGGECCWCREPKEDHPIEAGSNSHTGNYAAHEYVDQYDGHGTTPHEHIHAECPWCGSEDAQVGAYSRGVVEISCPDCGTVFRK